jgi:CNT family concentrative nucleoside transporter
MQRAVSGIAWVMQRTMKTSGAETLSAAANIFVGQTEAPLTIKPYIPKLTQSQLMAVMTGGFATIAGSVLAAYVGLLGGENDEARVLFAKHLITASVMSAPAGFVMAKLMVPETEQPREETLQALKGPERETRNVLDAAAAGATDGLKLALNVAAMLVAFVALLALINWPLSALSTWGAIDTWRVSKGLPEASLQNILGMALMPLAWLMGVAWHDCKEIASLLGQQVILTEFVAYLDLTRMIREGTIDSRSARIATYALCGFANLPSIAIQIGGLSALAPERRADLARLGLRAMTAGALGCWMTASIASVFIR